MFKRTAQARSERLKKEKERERERDTMRQEEHTFRFLSIQYTT